MADDDNSNDKDDSADSGDHAGVKKVGGRGGSITAKIWDSAAILQQPQAVGELKS